MANLKLMTDATKVKLITLKDLIKMRYSKLKDEQKENVYLTHDNEGRPFKVTVDTKDKTVTIVHLKRSFKFNYNNSSVKLSDYIDEWIQPIPYKKLFIGKGYKIYDEKTDESKIYYDGDWHIGSNILVQVEPTGYIYICDKITEFSTKEEITDLYSYVGNNDVVYSFAVSENYVYDLSSQEKILTIKRSDIESTIDSTLNITKVGGISVIGDQNLVCPRLDFCTLRSCS